MPTGAGEARALPRGKITNYTWAAWAHDGRRIVSSSSEESAEGSGYAYDHSTAPSVLFVISGALGTGAAASPTPQP
jgi:hypothetical protein